MLGVARDWLRVGRPLRLVLMGPSHYPSGVLGEWSLRNQPLALLDHLVYLVWAPNSES